MEANEPQQRVTQKALAETLGVSSAAITQARNARRLTRGDDGLYDLAESVASFRRNRMQEPKPGGPSRRATPAPVQPPLAGQPDYEPEVWEEPRASSSPASSRKPPAQAPATTGNAEDDLFVYRARQTKESWLKQRLERRKLQGSLVERAVVNQEWGSIAMRVREGILKVPHALAAAIAAESDARACRDLMLTALELALEKLSGVIEDEDDQGEDDDDEEAAA